MIGHHHLGAQLQHQPDGPSECFEPMNPEAQCLALASNRPFDTLQPINTEITEGIKTSGPLTSQLLLPASTANSDKSSVELYGVSPQLVDSHSPVIATKACSCIVCQDVNLLSSLPRARRFSLINPGESFQCRIGDCQDLFADFRDMAWCNQFCSSEWWELHYEKPRYVACHEISHFGTEGAYHCNEQYCQFITKRWRDLQRHYSTRHCKAPKKFPCHVLGCKYGGENGFARKDKLKSHVKNVHEGRLLPGQPGRIIKPRVIKPALSKKTGPEDQS